MEIELSDVISYFIGFLSALLVALITLWFQHKLEEKKIKKALVSELQINAKILARMHDYFKKTKSKKFYPILHTVVYEDLVRRGILYDLPEDLRIELVNVYNHIKAINSACLVSIWGLVPIDPDRAISELPQVIDQIINVTQRLIQLWKIKHWRRELNS
ncbi:MAG: hypothetical protein DRO13_06470 [Thermoprotei archaeon]|nr:MAG: hypothetical protein DRO13_06470 [Thermoprotei archaeon]